MTIDLTTLSRKELLELKADVEQALVDVAAREKSAALEAAKQAAQEFGFSLEELTGTKSTAKGPRKARAKSDVKYRNPQNPDQTWSGLGRRPNWVKDAIDAGKSLADLEI